MPNALAPADGHVRCTRRQIGHRIETDARLPGPTILRALGGDQYVRPDRKTGMGKQLDDHVGVVIPYPPLLGRVGRVSAAT
jgi:hypothetical protein